MTGFPAMQYGLRDRGFLMPGKKADIVVFDPKTIADKLSFLEPWAAPEGVHFVIKNGEIVVEGKKYLKKALGRIIRR